MFSGLTNPCVFYNVIPQYKISGNIFAGACIPPVLPSQVHCLWIQNSLRRRAALSYWKCFVFLQVLICSRNGSIYSFDLVRSQFVYLKLEMCDFIFITCYIISHFQCKRFVIIFCKRVKWTHFSCYLFLLTCFILWKYIVLTFSIIVVLPPGKGKYILGIQRWKSNYFFRLCWWALVLDNW